MEITSIENTSIHNLCISMFNAAPDAANLALIVGFYEANGNDLAVLADALAQNPIFSDQFTGLTDAQVATQMMANFGLVAGTTAGDNANAWIVANQATMTNAEILVAANTYLLDSVNRDAMFDTAATVLANKTTVAEYYSASASTATTFADLQAIVAGVDATAASVTTATDAIDAPLAAAAALVNVQNLQDANTELADFRLAEAQTDAEGEETAYVAGDIPALAVTATDAVNDIVTAGTDDYNNASAAVKAALLSDYQSALATTLSDFEDDLADAQAAVAAVSGLETAVTTLEAADAKEVTTIAAEAAAVIVEASVKAAWEVTSRGVTLIDASYNGTTDDDGTDDDGVLSVIVNDAGSTIFGDDDVLILTEVDADGIVTVITDTATVMDDNANTIADLTAEQLAFYQAQQALAADYIAAINANVNADAANTAANTAAAEALVAVKMLDLSTAAKTDLLEIGAAIEAGGGTVASVSTPTTAEIATYTTTVLDADIAADVTAADVVALAVGGTVLTGTLVVNADNSVDADLGTGVVALLDNNAGTIEIAAGLTADAGGLVAALIATVQAREDFELLESDFETSALLDTPLLTALGTAEDDVATYTDGVMDGGAQFDVDTLVAAAAAEVAADAVEADEALLIADVDTAEAVFTDAGDPLPVTVAAGLTATADNDIYLLSTADGVIDAFNDAGSDSIYVGTDFTLVTVAADETIATDNLGDVSTLEAFIVDDGTDTFVYFEDETFGGSAASTADLTTVELTGVTGAEVSIDTNGFLTIA